ncbi:hypothetical protein GQ457_04G000610 [Hibiscus cannabinus]
MASVLLWFQLMVIMLMETPKGYDENPVGAALVNPVPFYGNIVGISGINFPVGVRGANFPVTPLLMDIRDMHQLLRSISHAQRETASQTIELVKYLMEFNSSPGDLMELSPLFSDDSRVAEAASIAQKLPCNTCDLVQLEELRAENQNVSDSTVTIGRPRGASVSSSHQQISVAVVTEFVRWNEEALTRCTLFSSQPAILAANVKVVFTCLLDQVSQYITDGLERARDSLTEAAAMRERFVLSTSVSRRVAAAAASVAEAAAAAGESSFRSFMVSVQRCGSSVAIVQQSYEYLNKSDLLSLPVDGAHAASCEEMATAMSSAEGAAHKGLQLCIETMMAEVDRLLSAEQKATDYRSPDDGVAPDHRPTNACTRVVAYLSRVLEAAFTALEGLNKQAFLTELVEEL